MQRTVAGARDGSTPGLTVLSFPLHETPLFSGTVSAVTGAGTLTVAAADWTDGQLTATPYLVHIFNGLGVGRWLRITASGGAQLTLANKGMDLTTVVNAGDAIEIYQAHTLGTLFGTSEVALQSGAGAGSADLVSIGNGRKFKKYYFNGTNWTRGIGGANCNDVVIAPDSGVVVTRRSTEAVTLLFNGIAPDTVERSAIDGPGKTFLANRFPVATALGALGLSALPNWRDGATPDQADQVMILKKGVWVSYYFDGTNWHPTNKPAKIADSRHIATGTAVLVVRKSGAAGDEATLAQDPPYLVN